MNIPHPGGSFLQSAHEACQHVWLNGTRSAFLYPVWTIANSFYDVTIEYGE